MQSSIAYKSKNSNTKANSSVAGKSTSRKRKYDFQYKTISVLLIIFSVLLFFALLSYSSYDESNAQTSFSDVLKFFFNPTEELTAIASTTRNWLGLLGAIISYSMINYSFGFLICLLPLFLIAFSGYIYTGNTVNVKLLRRTSVYLLLAISFASLIGTMQHIEWIPQFSKEWHGGIGAFLAGGTVNIIGRFGSFVLFLGLMVITTVLGTEIRFKEFFKNGATYFENFQNEIIENFKRVFPSKTAETDNSDETLEDISPNSNNQHNDDQDDDNNNEVQTKSQDLETPEPQIGEEKKSDDKQVITDSKRANNQKNDNTAKMLRINLQGGFNPISAPFNLSNNIPSANKFDSNTEDEQTISINPEQNEIREISTGSFEESSLTEDSINDVVKIIKDEPTIQPSESEIDNNTIDENKTYQANTNEVNTIATKPLLPNKPLEVEIPTVTEQINDSTQEDEQEITKIVSDINPPQSKPLTVKVAEKKETRIVINDTKEPEFWIGTSIHDEKIDYSHPVKELLNLEFENKPVPESELRMNAQILQEKLETFKIFIDDMAVTPGPVVTQYEFVPAAGIKLSRIEGLSDDLLMALKAKGIRIIAPIPGRGTVGVEIPNSTPSLVRFSELAVSSEFAANQFKLPIALGKTISGEVYIADLTKMPHLLIAGSTGSGKSVGINTIITSLLYKLHPSKLKFVLIDPKKVELPQYVHLRKHFLAISPDIDDLIITNPSDAVIVLKSVVAEMEKRYDILASAGQRNITDYNSKVLQGAYKDNLEVQHREMPYIVVIIDELADLMLTASKEIEEPITRLAQMARAVGIHLILATQRPSVDVITGLIKANFPTRLAYTVTTKIDSRTILDMQGAEQLLGQGDMLFLPPGLPKPIRIQNAFISTDEVEAVCDFIGRQKGYSEPYYLPSLIEKSDGESFIDKDSRDPLFEEAAKLLIRHQQGSVSVIQRRLKVGYARAGRIIDELEDAGVVGPFDGSKARQVLMDSESELEAIL